MKNLLILFFMLSIIVSQGQNTITGNDTTEAKALSAALRNAIEQNIGTKIFSQSEVQRLEILKEILIHPSFGWVSSYKIISNVKKNEKKYEAKVSVTLKNDIKADWKKIQLAIRNHGNPLVTFSIKDTLDGKEILPSISEMYLASKFRNIGFTIIDNTIAQENKTNFMMPSKNADFSISGSVQGKFSQIVNVKGVKKIEHKYSINLNIVDVENENTVSALKENYVVLKDASISRQNAGQAGFAEIGEDKYLLPIVANFVKQWAGLGNNQSNGNKIIENKQPSSNSNKGIKIVISDIEDNGQKAIAKKMAQWGTILSTQQISSKKVEFRFQSNFDVEELIDKFLEANPRLSVIGITQKTLEFKLE